MTGSLGRRDRIITFAAERVAAGQSAESEPRAADGAMLLIRLDGVYRTRGMKAAVAAQERTEYGLIQAHQKDKWERGQR